MPELLSKLAPTATVTFDLSVFSLDCIKRASYRTTADSAVDISVEGGHAVCVIHFRSPVTPELAARASERLRLEVLDQDLRSIVAAETSTVRNTILALAFSRSGLQSDD